MLEKETQAVRKWKMMEVDEADLVYEKLSANVARAAERTSFVKVKTEADFVIEIIVNKAQSLFRH